LIHFYRRGAAMTPATPSTSSQRPEHRLTFPGNESAFVLSVLLADGSASRYSVPPQPGHGWSGERTSAMGT